MPVNATPAPRAPSPSGPAEPGDAAATVELPDGTVVCVRPITPADVAALVEFHEHLSADTIYRRYFAPHPHLAASEAEHFCVVDGYYRYALAATLDGEIIGVARMERLDPPTRAEVAFLLTDRFQHRGLGRVLAERLLDAARARGVQEVIADTLSDNYPMIHLLADLGYPVAYTRDQGIIRITCQLPRPPAQGAPV
ncbi:GNAT family N-acetyltransferase [Acidiferrimicrobium sp. IK]|uniref:GNAT family N-acetyltransferase n=1 Tax=Acidiferrimicrobium sp. IK TaxID=2871700 RepID=UPI0021CAF287|nr:GNAT family N-acetyltransferase [Acidiferrimicrobium sp. IK]MCU4182859.1 GNAT family N-acetyltransferase [Acidiferrimicrobium sp. IK]